MANGTDNTDAVNVGQLNQALGAISGNNNANIVALDAKVNDVANTANAGVAQAIATAGLPQAYLPGKNMVAVGGGYYKGETGYAIGFSTISDNGNWIIKATGSGNSRGNFGGSIGAGYQW
ncbi:YadA-like family protein [Eikenella sp. S3360]|uniref:YadA-like family protein n=1 Tax=Eikenella glucosivorans TaxID=2766967 RepID=A0ABS0NAN1_9NEIS|nr:YadA-like family protein [Eikenella glucosivorans]